MQQLQVSGKFFRTEKSRCWLKMVTYGPFPDPQPDHLSELARVAAAGFNAIRIYGEPSTRLLDAAEKHRLWVFVGPSWQWGRDFIGQPSLLAEAELTLAQGLKNWGNHPAVAGVFVANEIASDMARWMGVHRVRETIERLIRLGKNLCPQLLFAYSSFPTTEYLEPENADFTAMNIYLNQAEELAAYLPRLHHVAGDRPVVVSEFGFDSMRGGLDNQANLLEETIRECLHAGVAGLTIYSWSDRWFNAGKVIEDWDFGLTDRNGNEKPSLRVVADRLQNVHRPEDGLQADRWPMFSVIICTYNGASRIKECLTAATSIDYPNYEVIVVDDGSMDDTVDVVQTFPDVRLIKAQHGGLSAARNLGAEKAQGEIFAYTDDDCMPDAAWLRWLAWGFLTKNWDACGGPNLPPLPEHPHDIAEAVVAAAPGAPTHVMLDDSRAEHLPGCNLTVTRQAFEKINGFRARYRVAGDDVDFCWRLEQADMRLGFHGAAFVWHRRRTTLWRYFKQQWGYGKAEAILLHDHPDKFSHQGARWQGCVYQGGAMSADSDDVIYHGSMGTAAYQQIAGKMQPQRPLAQGFNTASARWRLALSQWLQPHLRRWARKFYGRKAYKKLSYKRQQREFLLMDNFADRFNEYESQWHGAPELSRNDVLDSLLESGWSPLMNDPDWDMQRDLGRILIAREQHDASCTILIRIELPTSSQGLMDDDLLESLAELGLVRG